MPVNIIIYLIDRLLHSSTIVLTVFNEPKITYAGKIIRKKHTMQNLLIIIIINNNMQAEISQHTNCLYGQGDQGAFS